MARVSEVSQRALIALAFLAGTLVVYLYNLQYRVWGAGGDTTPAEMLPLALMRNHDLVFDGVGDPRAWWFHRVNGHLISNYPIVPGLFNVPAYLVAHARGVPLDQAHRSMLSVISASIVVALSVCFFFLAVSRIVERRSTAVGATLVYAFGTTAMSVAARGMWQHGPSLLFITVALWLLTRGDVVSVALSGLPLGFAVFNRPVNIVIVAPLAAYVLWRHRRAFLPLTLCAAIPAALMAWYSVRYWGSLRSLGQYPAEGRFSGHVLQGLSGLLLNPNRGLLVFTPLFAFSFAAIAYVLRRPARDPLLTALSVGALGTVGVYSIWDMWWGGSCFGYRLLTELVPSLTLLLAVGWERLFMRSRTTRVAFAVAAAFSLYANFLGAFYYPCGFDTEPNEINAHRERLWDLRDGEIARCSAKLLGRIESHLHR